MAKNYSAYRITYSTDAQVAVGELMLSPGIHLFRDWTLINDGGKITQFGGPRVARLCTACRDLFGVAKNLGHEGSHGQEAPPLVTKEGGS